MTSSRLTRFAWGVLAANVAVILWGAWVRITGSGAGCGSHWPTCNGEVIPQAASTKTLIEFSHRASSGLVLVLVVALFAWVFRAQQSGHPSRRAAAWSLFFILMEAVLGAGLVLLRLVEHDQSVQRVVALSAHLVNTLMLLGALTLTAWHLSGGAQLRWGTQARGARGLRWSLGGLVLVAIAGGIAALGDTLYPASSLAQGMAQDWSGAAPGLLRLRLLHPALAMIVAIFVFTVALRARNGSEDERIQRAAGWVMTWITAQCALGVLNVGLLAPNWLQIVHLCAGDLVWIATVLFAAESLSRVRSEEPLAEAAPLELAR